MLVLMPVNGYWYDHIGFPKTERNAYYKNIRKLAAEYGADLADFAKDEYTRYFFLDKVHLGWKGCWISMKAFTALRQKLRQSNVWSYGKYVLLFYGLMMAIYGYFMLANLSTAPKFIYAQF